MHIRIMSTDDYDAVYALWISCTGMGLNDPDDSKAGIAKFLARNPETCFVAETGDQIAGVILAGNDGRRGYIYHTAVRPEYRKQGIGSQLLSSVLEAFKKIGISKAALVVFDKNKSGNDFWEKKGFTSRGDLVYRNKALTDIRRIDT